MSDLTDNRRWPEVLAVFLRLGLTSFGGPVAHIGYFRNEIVTRRRWIDDAGFADLLALCQFLPGPASSQLGFALGWQRAGAAGALAACVGFTLPSALVLIVLAMLAGGAGDAGAFAGLARGLKITAVAVVAHAVWGMARSLTPDGPRAAVALAALMLVALLPGLALAQIAAIAMGALAGGAFGLAPSAPGPGDHAALRGPSARAGMICLALFLAGLVILPLLAGQGALWSIADLFWRAGALVFGGGHVVLPLLQQGAVGGGLVSADTFLTGYGAAQAVPGPLFTFAGWLGQAAAGLPGALIALAAIFLPGFLILMAALPFWSAISASRAARHALAGTNAAVVGLLAAALYDPVFTGGIRAPGDFALAATLLMLLALWRLPAWAVVICGAAGGAALSLIGA